MFFEGIFFSKFTCVPVTFSSCFPVSFMIKTTHDVQHFEAGHLSDEIKRKKETPNFSGEGGEQKTHRK